jgi:hypothetical protein
MDGLTVLADEAGSVIAGRDIEGQFATAACATIIQQLWICWVIKLKNTN